MSFVQLKKRVRSLIRDVAGYDIRKFEPGVDAYVDIQRLLGPSTRSPNILDIGANVGQTVDILVKLFPLANIHAFEPNSCCIQLINRDTFRVAERHLQ